VNALDGQQWVEVKNNNAAQVPAYGIMRITGVSVVNTGRVVITVDQPNAYGDIGTCLINGPTPIPSGLYGMGTRMGIITAYYDNGDGTPAFGDFWGPRTGTWKLKKNTGGFFCLGGPTNSGQNLALFVPSPMLIVRGTIASDAAPDSNSALTVYTGAYGSEATTGQSISNIRNASDCTLKSGSGARVHSAIFDWTVGGGGGFQFAQGRTA
jgi:hypothetical protein